MAGVVERDETRATQGGAGLLLGGAEMGGGPLGGRISISQTRTPTSAPVQFHLHDLGDTPPERQSQLYVRRLTL